MDSPDRSAAYFYVYAIAFDQDVFGCFATREEAEASLERQIAEGGPAWEDCEVERWRIEGTPEVGGVSDTWFETDPTTVVDVG